MWAEFFNRPSSSIKLAIDVLLDDDRAALVGPILAEVLVGFRRDGEADWVASELRGLHYLETNWDNWRAAARLGRNLATQGHQLPLSDLVIASKALSLGCAVYTTDPHFDLFPDLIRHAPA
jgi:predicted nucleic acid-binding protein